MMQGRKSSLSVDPRSSMPLLKNTLPCSQAVSMILLNPPQSHPARLLHCSVGTYHSVTLSWSSGLLVFIFFCSPSHGHLDCVLQFWLQLPRLCKAQCRLASSSLSQIALSQKKVDVCFVWSGSRKRFEQRYRFLNCQLPSSLPKTVLNSRQSVAERPARGYACRLAWSFLARIYRLDRRMTTPASDRPSVPAPKTSARTSDARVSSPCRYSRVRPDSWG